MTKLTADEITEYERTMRSLVRRDGYESLEAFAAEVRVDVSGGYTEGVLDRLAKAEGVLRNGREVQAARESVAFWMEATKFAIREADGAGIPRAWIARAAGVTRQTVYDTLSD